MVHPDLEDAELRLARHPGKAQRHAPMIVERCGRGMHRAGCRERVPEGFLCRRLADAAGHRDDLRLASGARGGGEAFQRHQHVIDDDELPLYPAERRQLLFGDDKHSGPRRSSRRQEGMPVEALAFDGKEGFTRLQRPRVDREARDTGRHRADRAAADRLDQSLGFPKKLAHRPASRIAARTSS